MKEKSIKNIRKEFKDNGIFYTPPELALRLKSYIDFEPESVYELKMIQRLLNDYEADQEGEEDE